MAYRPRAGSGFRSGLSDIHPSVPFRPTCRTDILYNFPRRTQALNVPYEQRNKEMYPIIQARSTLLEDLLGVCGKPVSGICERGIEAGVFETGMVLVNHRSTPYEIGNLKGNRKFTNPVNDTVLLPHSAVWIERE